MQGNLTPNVLMPDQFDFFHSELKVNNSPYTPSDGAEMETTFLFEGNNYIYSLEMVGLRDSPGVAVAVVGTEDALSEEALPLK